MPQSFSFGRADGGTELFNGTATTGQTTLAAQTTLVAAATKATGGLNVVTPIAGSTAFRLPKDVAVGSPIVVTNTAATAVALSVFPPFDDVAAAAAGGKIYGAAITLPAANAAVSVGQGRTVVFYPHPNGIDFTAVWGAVA